MRFNQDCPTEAEIKEFEPRLKHWLVPLEIVFSVSRYEPVLNWTRILADQRRGLKSLNSASGKAKKNVRGTLKIRISELYFFNVSKKSF